MSNAQKLQVVTGFAGLPFGPVSECAVGEVGILGVPCEVEKGPRFGAALAPDALRAMAERVGTEFPAPGRDLGNIEPTGDWSGAVGQLVSQMAHLGVVPVVLGGAEDVATAVLGALPELPVVAAMPRIREDLVAREVNTVWLGLNGAQPAEVWGKISQRSMLWRTARQLDEGGIANISKIPERGGLWLDVSVIDLGHAAGVVGLNPGGMKPETLVATVEAMACEWQVIVITGLAPARDTRGLSELAALETLTAAFRHG
ncbi:arginase family protein [Ruegeria hyattellae]|uniref:arginase family protein n=1 Tax=Ruegeria hyattellae TaxID=3233337 RepID=UPI00355C25AD